MATQPNVQFLCRSERFRNFAGEELRVNYILEIGGVVRYDINDSLDDFPVKKRSEGAHDPSVAINPR